MFAIGAIPRAAVALTVGAWAVMAVGVLTGWEAALHHHELIEHGPPLWVAALLFLGAWLVMVAAMMLPSSAPAIGQLAALPTAMARPMVALGGFLLPYLAVWSVFGLAAFAGDVVVHAFVDATPWLAERPYVIAAATFGLAGVYELTPLKQQALALCRAPQTHIGAGDSPFRIGLEHASACLVSSGGLMLVMFGAGIANPLWMVAMTAVMAYQALGRHGLRTPPLVATALLGLAFLIIANPTGALATLLA